MQRGRGVSSGRMRFGPPRVTWTGLQAGSSCGPERNSSCSLAAWVCLTAAACPACCSRPTRPGRCPRAACCSASR
eukprot:482014-Alexandrium_andersonii.AAC.1